MGGNWIILYAKPDAQAEQLKIVPKLVVSDGAKVFYNGELYDGGAIDCSKTQRIILFQRKITAKARQLEKNILYLAVF